MYFNIDTEIKLSNEILTLEMIQKRKESFLNNSFLSLGYLCERRHLEKTTSCCQTTSPSILGPYICDTCSSTSHCCSSFEHCISCCLKPDHV